jgi:hypothetical protein
MRINPGAVMTHPGEINMKTQKPTDATSHKSRWHELQEINTIGELLDALPSAWLIHAGTILLLYWSFSPCSSCCAALCLQLPTSTRAPDPEFDLVCDPAADWLTRLDPGRTDVPEA